MLRLSSAALSLGITIFLARLFGPEGNVRGAIRRGLRRVVQGHLRNLGIRVGLIMLEPSPVSTVVWIG